MHLIWKWLKNICPTCKLSALYQLNLMFWSIVRSIHTLQTRGYEIGILWKCMRWKYIKLEMKVCIWSIVHSLFHYTSRQRFSWYRIKFYIIIIFNFLRRSCINFYLLLATENVVKILSLIERDKNLQLKNESFRQ